MFDHARRVFGLCLLSVIVSQPGLADSAEPGGGDDYVPVRQALRIDLSDPQLFARSSQDILACYLASYYQPRSSEPAFRPSILASHGRVSVEVSNIRDELQDAVFERITLHASVERTDSGFELVAQIKSSAISGNFTGGLASIFQHVPDYQEHSLIEEGGRGVKFLSPDTGHGQRVADDYVARHARCLAHFVERGQAGGDCDRRSPLDLLNLVFETKEKSERCSTAAPAIRALRAI